MIVKDIFLSNREIFEELLIRDLIERQISYVKIGDEFHFNDSIYRFHDAKEVEQPTIESIFNIIDLSFKKREDFIVDMSGFLDFNKDEQKTSDYHENEIKIDNRKNIEKIKSMKIKRIR